MFVIKALWLVYSLFQVESLLQGTYFAIEEDKNISREVLHHIPNSSSVACVISCKQNPACKTPGITKDHECYLFGETGAQQNNGGVTLTLLRYEQVLGPDDKGMAFDLYQKYGMNSNSLTQPENC